MNGNRDTPPVRDSGATGVPESDKRDLVDDEAAMAAEAPKMSGAPVRGREPLTNPRGRPEQGGCPRERRHAPPRPTSKPIVGGDKGSAS